MKTPRGKWQLKTPNIRKRTEKNTGNDFSVAERVHEIRESHKRGRENFHSSSVHFQPLPFIKQWETHNGFPIVIFPLLEIENQVVSQLKR